MRNRRIHVFLRGRVCKSRANITVVTLTTGWQNLLLLLLMIIMMMLLLVNVRHYH